MTPFRRYNGVIITSRVQWVFPSIVHIGYIKILLLRVIKPIFAVQLFSQFSALSKHCLPVKYHIHI